MKNRDILEELLEALEFRIRDVRQALRTNRLPLDQLPPQLKDLLERIINLFAEIEYDSELEEKRQIYDNIAQFLQEKFQEDMETCQHVTYILCNESEQRLIGENFPSTKAKKIAESAKKFILTIQVHYERFKASGICNRKTEIFSVNPYENKPTVKRINEEVSWDNISSKVRERFITTGGEGLSCTLYPEEE